MTASIYYFGLEAGFNSYLVILVALAVGFPLRVLSIAFKWGMPKFVYDKELR